MARLDVLADPVRLAVARRLARGRASASEVARSVGVHLNTARAHLAALAEAGVASREQDPADGPGRPVVRYRLKGDWQPSGDDLLGLAQLLASALSGRPERSRDRARRWGKRAAGDQPSAPDGDLRGMLHRLGFEARVEQNELTLSNCPCPLASPERPALVCGLVDAAIDGALDSRGVTATAHHHDPKARHCCMALTPA